MPPTSAHRSGRPITPPWERTRRAERVEEVGLRPGERPRRVGMATRFKLPRPPRPPSPGEMWERTRESQVWKSIFRPGSIYRAGYRDTSRDRALAMMNNVLYHLHPVKVKRHGLKLTYTFCLGGLSFFLFILLTMLLSFTGYLLPWDQLAIWAVAVGTSMMGYTPVIGNQVRFVLLGSVEIGPATLIRWYVLHVLALPFVATIFLAVHFWRIRKDGGISGPL